MPQLIMDTNPNAEEQVKAPEEQAEEAQAETLESLKEENVPLKKYMSEKNARKSAEEKVDEIQAEMETLKAKMAQGMTVDNANDEVKRISQAHNVDEQFLVNLVETVSNQTRERIEKELNPDIQALKQDKETRDFNQKFETLITKSLAELPEYKDIIDTEDLKEWALNPKYSKLTMVELIEEKYSKYLSKKKPSEFSHSAREPKAPNTDSPVTDEDWQAMRKDKDKSARFNEELMKYL